MIAHEKPNNISLEYTGRWRLTGDFYIIYVMAEEVSSQGNMIIFLSKLLDTSDQIQKCYGGDEHEIKMSLRIFHSFMQSGFAGTKIIRRSERAKLLVRNKHDQG